MDKQGRPGADHDEEGHEVGEKCTDIGIQLLVAQMHHLDPLVGNSRLLIELHPRRDGGADDRDQSQQIALVELEGRVDCGMEDQCPVRMYQEAAGNVTRINKAQGQQDALDIFVAAANDEEPDQHGRYRDGDERADPEDIHGSGDSCELGHRGRGIGDEQQQAVAPSKSQGLLLIEIVDIMAACCYAV